MELIRSLNNLSKNIKIEDCSISFMTRLRLTFPNGLGISIIRGYGSFGGSQGFFEIAPLDKKGDMDGSLLSFIGDDVEGYLTREDVIDRCKKIMSIKGN